MIKHDYKYLCEPVEGNAVTATGFILRILAGIALAIVLGAEWI